MNDRSRQQGQAIALLAISMAAIVLGVAVVVDGGYAFAQRRVSQNAADFAAMAGTRMVGQARINNPATAADVTNAVNAALAANQASLVDAAYIDDEGTRLGNVVGAASIPDTAFGVTVEASTSWQPFLLGLIGDTDWVADSQATAKTPGRALGGGVMPVGIRDTHFGDIADRTECDLTDFETCVGEHLTTGQLNMPGSFGWLTFGLNGTGGNCPWTSSLGMLDDGGCAVDKPFLQSQVGPPANSHGCCTAVGQEGSVDLIGGLVGNKVAADLSFYIENQIPVWAPIWDWVDENGRSGHYHIVGFGALVFTAEQGAKQLYGVPLQNACKPGTEIAGEPYCTAPGGPFVLEGTGEVELIR
jgi:hypothetical protein